MRNKKGVSHVEFGIAIIAGLFFLLVTTGIGIPLLTSGDEDSFNKKIPLEVAGLKEFTEHDLNSYKSYEKFAQEFNNLGEIINNQKIVQIPKLDTSEATHKRILKFIVEFGPLVDNYNQVIGASKVYNRTRSQKDLELFYSQAGNFALELSLINAAVFYSPSYKTVGTIYRASGLQVIAPKCGGCVSVVLSTSHWTIRNGLVELMSQFSGIVEKKEYGWEGITVKSLKDNTSPLLETTKTITGEILQDVKDYDYSKTGNKINEELNESTNIVRDWLKEFFDFQNPS